MPTYFFSDTQCGTSPVDRADDPNLFLSASCPSYLFWTKGHFDQATPPYLQSLDKIELALTRLMATTSSHEDSSSPVGDILQRLIRSKVIKYNHNETALNWRRFSISLPLAQVCQSLAITEISSLSVLFSNYNGLQTLQLNDLQDYVHTVNSVKFTGVCNLYDTERVRLKMIEFLTTLDLVFNAEIDGRYLLPFFFQINGTVLNAMEWYPQYVDRWNYLLSAESNSEYYKFLKHGAKYFTHRRCAVLISSAQYIDDRLKTGHLTKTVLEAYKSNPSLLPPLRILQNSTAEDWESVFGDQWQKMNNSFHYEHQLYEDQTPNARIRLSVMIYNRYNFKSNPNDFGLLLHSITEENNLRKKSEEVHSRAKRTVITVLLKGAQLVQKAIMYLYKYFQGWFQSVVGNNITSKVIARSTGIRNTIGNKLTPYWKKLQEQQHSYIAVIRSRYEKSSILKSLGSFHNNLLRFVPTGTAKITPKLKLGAFRYSHLTLPKTIPTGFISRFSAANKRLRKRFLDTWVWAKRNKASLATNAAGIALFGLTDYAVMSSFADSEDPLEDPLEEIPSCSDPSCYDPDAALHTNPLTESSLVNDLQIIGSNFYFAPTVNQTIRELLQAEIFPRLDNSTNTDEKLQVREMFTNENYDITRPNIYDVTIDQQIRQKALIQQRNLNQVNRFRTSFTYKYATYSDISPSHKKSLVCTQQFLGFLTLASRILQPDEFFMEQALDLLVSLDTDDRRNYCNEIRNYLLIAYKQIEEQRTAYTESNFDVASLPDLGRLTNDFSNVTLISPDKNDLQADNFEAFAVLLRVRGQQTFRLFNEYLDRILAMDQERQYWISNFKIHRLLWQDLGFTPPNVQADYLQEFVTYFTYLTQNNLKPLIDQFIQSQKNLTAIRLWSENLVVGFSTSALEREISSVDLKALKKHGLNAIVPKKSKSEFDADAQIKLYDELLEAANHNEDFLEYSPELDEYEDETSLRLINELQPGVTPPKKWLDKMKKMQEEKKKQAEENNDVVNRIKRHAEGIFKNITMHPEFQNEKATFLSNPENMARFLTRSKFENNPLSLTDYLTIHRNLQNDTRRYRYSEYIEAHYSYLKMAAKLIIENDLEPELMCLFADPAVLEEIPLEKRRLIEASHTVLKIDYLPTLMERSSLVKSLTRVIEMGDKVRTITKYRTEILATLKFIEPIFHLLVLIGAVIFICRTIKDLHNGNLRATEYTPVAPQELQT